MPSAVGKLLRLMSLQRSPSGDCVLREEKPTERSAAVNPFTAEDVAEILRQHGWLTAEPSAEQSGWCERAASLLGPHTADRAALGGLLALVFHYDAHEIIARVDSHVVLSRYAAGDVLRQLALLLLDGTPLTSERFKEIVSALKEGLDLRGRELFHPLRLALAGRSGEGELDRVILLLDDAASLPFAVPVKPARARILEFCASLD
jgi:nondiscriminating glutamyl-tRNA synthetase